MFILNIFHILSYKCNGMFYEWMKFRNFPAVITKSYKERVGMV